MIVFETQWLSVINKALTAMHVISLTGTERYHTRNWGLSIQEFVCGGQGSQTDLKFEFTFTSLSLCQVLQRLVATILFSLF
jgi:hypothetical protein